MKITTAAVSGISQPVENASATPNSEVSLPKPILEISRNGKNSAAIISTTWVKDSATIWTNAPSRGRASTVWQRTQRAVSPDGSSSSTCSASQRGQATSPAPVVRSYWPSFNMAPR